MVSVRASHGAVCGRWPWTGHLGSGPHPPRCWCVYVLLYATYCSPGMLVRLCAMQLWLEPPSHCPSSEQDQPAVKGFCSLPHGAPRGVHPVLAAAGGERGRSAPPERLFSFLHLAQSFVWLQLFETKLVPLPGCPMAQRWLG